MPSANIICERPFRCYASVSDVDIKIGYRKGSDYENMWHISYMCHFLKIFDIQWPWPLIIEKKLKSSFTPSLENVFANYLIFYTVCFYVRSPCGNDGQTNRRTGTTRIVAYMKDCHIQCVLLTVRVERRSINLTRHAGLCAGACIHQASNNLSVVGIMPGLPA